MALIGDLFKYTPSSAFSFAIHSRNPLNGFTNPVPMIEAFMLLPPEEVTIKEGYKVTVTKTIDGAWVDDHGNDVKKISISGSLYSYYFGIPATNFGGVFSNLIKKSLDQIPPAVFGYSALDEFFKLRYMLSRFRDKKDDGISEEETKLFAKFPELGTLIGFSNLGWTTYDNLMFVYHDYDDGNHYEVVFHDFTMRRSKDDPFTLNYSIEMTALKRVSSAIRLFGILGLGLKETFQQVINSINNTLTLALSDAQEIIVGGIVDASGISYFNNVLASVTSFVNSLNTYINGTASNIRNLLSQVKENIVLIQEASDYLIRTKTNGQQQDVYDDILDLDDKTFVSYNYYRDLLDSFTILAGLESYISNVETVNITKENDADVTTDDVPFEAQKDGNNQNVENKIFYYTIQQEDDLYKIANKFYNDYTYSTLIGKTNKIKNEDFLNGSLIGQIIKIPILNRKASTLSLEKNLVYSKITPLSTPVERQKQVLGVDIRLSNDRDFVIDGSGDISAIYGEETYFENIKDRLSYSVGSLGDVHPEWGVLVTVGQVPMKIKYEKIIDTITAQVLLDPRAERAYIKTENVEIDGDKIFIPLVTKPLTGSERIINAADLLPGQLL